MAGVGGWGGTKLFQMRLFHGLNKDVNFIMIKVFILMKCIYEITKYLLIMDKKWAKIETEKSNVNLKNTDRKSGLSIWIIYGYGLYLL